MRKFITFVFLACSAQFLAAQCELPKSQFEQAHNIFTVEQENYLGDIVTEQARRGLRLIGDKDLNGYPDRVLQQLLKGVPASPYTYHVQMIDEPYSNAFSTIGARIYITRKAALLARSEDEFAGVLAHEISHIYTRQMGADFTRLFEQVLGPTQVTDRADVTRKYHQVLDTWRKKHLKFDRKHSDQEQFVADQTAVFMMARAGYRAGAYGEYFDRLAETQGKTGGFWTDFFGGTPPEGKRLRAILDNVSHLPATCISQTKPAESDFKGWQNSLLEWSGATVADDFHNLVLQKRLLPPLLSDVHLLRFSRDGKYILAQDDSTVSVITLQPFAFLFRVDLPQHPLAASFSPDSSHLIVGNESGRVEKWDLVSLKRDSVHELPMLRECLQSQLSPDGNYMACLTTDFTLLVTDTATGEKKLEKKQFLAFTWAIYFQLAMRNLGVRRDLMTMDFAPDGHAFGAGSGDNLVVMETKTWTPLEVKGNLKSRMKYSFAFSGDNQVVTRDPFRPAEAYVQEFPSGNPVRTMNVGGGGVSPVSKGGFAIVNSGQEVAGIYDMAAGKFVASINSHSAFDMYDKLFVSERRNGFLELGEYDGQFSPGKKSVQLETPQLGRLQVATLSDDLGWLAISQGSRGGIFKLADGSRMALLRGFSGGWFDAKEQFWADFPKQEKTERTIVAMNVAQNSFLSNRPVKSEDPVRQEGPYLVITKPEHPGRYSENSTLEVHDTRDDKLLWSKQLKGNPRMWSDWQLGTVVFSWSAASPQAKEAAKSDSVLATHLAQLSNRDESYFLEVADFATGNVVGHLAVDSGKHSFYFRRVEATRDTAVAADNSGRLHVYSLKDGEEQNVVFAENFALSMANVLVVEADEHRVQILDAKSGDKLDEYTFASPVAFCEFLGDGNRLLVLTRNQTAYVFKPQANLTDAAQSASQ